MIPILPSIFDPLVCLLKDTVHHIAALKGSKEQRKEAMASAIRKSTNGQVNDKDLKKHMATMRQHDSGGEKLAKYRLAGENS